MLLTFTLFAADFASIAGIFGFSSVIFKSLTFMDFNCHTVVLLLCGCLSLNPFIEFSIRNNSSSSDVLNIQAYSIFNIEVNGDR